MPARNLKCVDCGEWFEFSERDQEFFKSKGFEDPRRCKLCREAKKQARRARALEEGTTP
jgi:hypothetical protein